MAQIMFSWMRIRQESWILVCISSEVFGPGLQLPGSCDFVLDRKAFEFDRNMILMTSKLDLQFRCRCLNSSISISAASDPARTSSGEVEETKPSS